MDQPSMPSPSANPSPSPDSDPEGSRPGEIETAQVIRSVRIDAPAEAVWRSLADPGELAIWLQADVQLDGALVPGVAGRVTDPDGAIRHMLITDVDAGRRVAWHWWEDGGELSSVEITATPDGETTEVRVVETVALAAVTSGGSRASAMSGVSDRFDRRWNTALPTLVDRFAAKLGVVPVSLVG
jgi:uncharacterized protein YndB with AHSA1/START domain